MRKALLLSVVLVSVVLLAAALSGCGSNNGVSPTPTPTPTPSSTYVYVTLPDFQSAGDGQIAAFKLNSDGTLTPVPGSPFSHAGAFVLTTLGASGLAVASSPTLCCIQPTISTWAINPTTGALSQHSADTNMPVVSAIAADLAGQFVYLAAGRNGTFGFSNHSGTLSTVPGSPFNVVDDPVSGALKEHDAVAVTPSGKTVLMGTRELGGHTVSAALEAAPKGSDGSLGTVHGDLAASHFGGTPDIVVHPNNQIVYAVTEPLDGFQLDELTTTVTHSTAITLSLLNALGSYRPMFFSGGMAMDSAGKFLFVGDDTSQSVFVMSVLADGTVQAVPESPFSTGLPLPSPTLLAANLLPRLDPQNRFVVLLHSGPSAGIPEGVEPAAPGIMVFALDATSGSLTLKGDTSLPRPALDLALVRP
jgi:6-phosphogluconolactonase (cycloisomerase 2 family)